MKNKTTNFCVFSALCLALTASSFADTRPAIKKDNGVIRSHRTIVEGSVKVGWEATNQYLQIESNSLGKAVRDEATDSFGDALVTVKTIRLISETPLAGNEADCSEYIYHEDFCEKRVNPDYTKCAKIEESVVACSSRP